MTTIGEDLNTFILGSTAISDVVGTRVHQNNAPQDSSRPYIWYIRASEEEPLTLDGVGGANDARFDVECISADIDEAIALSDDVKARLHGHQGALGNATAQGVFVEDKDDDYITRGNESDEGLHVAALDVRIWF